MEYRFTRKADVQKFCKLLRKQFIIPVVLGKVVQIYKPESMKEPERTMRIADKLYCDVMGV